MISQICTSLNSENFYFNNGSSVVVIPAEEPISYHLTWLVESNALALLISKTGWTEKLKLQMAD